MIIHTSEIGIIEFKKVNNGFVNNSDFVFFKIKNLYSNNLSDELIEKLFDDLKTFFDNSKKNKIIFTQIYDLTDVSVTNIQNELIFVKKYADFLKKFDDVFRECNTGTSIVINSFIVKQIINTMLCVYESITPTHISTSYGESFEWLEKLINKNLKVKI